MRRYSTVPILESITYPLDILKVPVSLFVGNTVLFLVVMVVARNALEGFALLIILAVWAAVHAYIAYRFIKNPHIEGHWRAAAFSSRRWPWQRSSNMVPSAGNTYSAV